MKVKSSAKRWTPDVDKVIDQPVLRDDNACQAISSPVYSINRRDQASQTDPLPITKSISLTDSSEKTRVFVRAEWHSGAGEKQLPTKLCSLGKMLVRGTLKQIAYAAWNAPGLREHLKF